MKAHKLKILLIFILNQKAIICLHNINFSAANSNPESGSSNQALHIHSIFIAS